MVAPTFTINPKRKVDRIRRESVAPPARPIRSTRRDTRGSGHKFATVTLGNARNGRFDDSGTEGSPRATNSAIRARSSPFSRAHLLSPSRGRALSSSLFLSRRLTPPLAAPRVTLVPVVAGPSVEGGGDRTRGTRDFRDFTIGVPPSLGGGRPPRGSHSERKLAGSHALGVFPIDRV